MSLCTFLKSYIDKFPFLEAIVLSDKEGNNLVIFHKKILKIIGNEISSGYKNEDFEGKEKLASMLFVAALN